VALPAGSDQTFDGIAETIEESLRTLEAFVLFAESFSAPIAARIAHRLGQKVALLVLCNPLVEAPLDVFPSFVSALLRVRVISTFAVAMSMTGGDRLLAESIVREVRKLPKRVLEQRVAAACNANRVDLRSHLTAPLVVITGTNDRLLSPRLTRSLVQDVPFAVIAELQAPHLAAQVVPSQVWAVITEEFERAA
jgi:pimeloyl-ACP methyl ester carboxylesterase